MYYQFMCSSFQLQYSGWLKSILQEQCLCNINVGHDVCRITRRNQTTTCNHMITVWFGDFFTVQKQWEMVFKRSLCRTNCSRSSCLTSWKQQTSLDWTLTVKLWNKKYWIVTLNCSGGWMNSTRFILAEKNMRNIGKTLCCMNVTKSTF